MAHFTRSFTDYHVPANLDIGDMVDAIFIREDDQKANKMGVKGIGEVGIVGVTAVANAIFNATGKRVRELPVTPDKLL